MSSSSAYSSLSQPVRGDESKAAAGAEEEAVDAALIEDELTMNLNTESDDEDYLQVHMEDSYRPPVASSTTHRSKRSVLLIGVLVLAIVLVLLVLAVTVLVYGTTLLTNLRAASASWSNVLAPAPNGLFDNSTAGDSDGSAVIPDVADPVLDDTGVPEDVNYYAEENYDESLSSSSAASELASSQLSAASSSSGADSEAAEYGEGEDGAYDDDGYLITAVPSTSSSSIGLATTASSTASSASTDSSASSLSAAWLASSDSSAFAASSASAAPASTSSTASLSPSSTTASFLTSLLSSAGSAATGSSGPLQDKTAKPALLAHLASYVARHYSSPDMTLDPSRKYVVFTPTDDGLGNKLLPLLSSFFLALMLDRTWLVHWVGTEAINNSKIRIEEVFQAPDGMHWSWPQIVERSKAKAGESNTGNASAIAQVGDQYTLFRTSLCSVAGAFGLSCSELDMGGAGTEHADQKVGLSCEDWRTDTHWAADNVIVNWGDQYYVPITQVNAAYRPLMLELFDEDDIFGPLARFLLRPSATIAPYIVDMQQRFWTDRYVVSMQLRRRERLGLRGPEVNTAIKCAKKLAVDGKAATGKDVTFFVASDDAQLRDDLIQKMRPEGEVVHVANFTVREQQLGVFFAAIDILLLSRGDAIVTTPSSTFGYSSAGFGSLIPRRVQLSPGTDCDVAVNSEPSSHFFHAMVGYSKEHQPYCVDFEKYPHLMAQEGCCPRW